MTERAIPRALAIASSLLAMSLVGVSCKNHNRPRDVELAPASPERLIEARDIAQRAGVQARRAARLRETGKNADESTAKAVELYRQALTLHRSMPEAWNNLGVLLMEQQDYLAASEAFTMAMELSPADPRPAENLGLVYDRAGWGEESLRCYRLALDRDPNYRPALRGAIRAAHLLGIADQRTLDTVRQGLMLENEPEWRALFEREKLRIEGRIEAERQAAAAIAPKP